MLVQRLEELEVLGGIHEVILTTDDMAHFHFDVVHHVDKMKDKGAIRAPHHHIGRVGLVTVVNGDFTAHQVVHGDRSAFEAEAPGSFVLVDPVGRAQFLKPSLVNFRALRLEVGPTGAAGLVALIPVQAQPAHPVEDGLPGLPGVAGLVGVFHPENESTPVLAGKKPIEERGPCSAHVEITGGGGGEAGADRS